IALALRFYGAGADLGAALALAKTFPIEKPERLLAAVVELRSDHGPARGYAVLVLAEGQLANSRFVIEEVVRIERVIAEILVGAAVEIARSGLDSDIDVGARGPAELRRSVIEDFELLNRIHRRRSAGRVHE